MDRKVTLGEVRDKGTDTVFEDELRKLIAQLKNKSLPSRADILFRKAPIVHNTKTAASEYFRLSTLKELDELRHDIVHRGGLSRIDVALTKDRLAFLLEAASTAIRSVAVAYNVGIDKEYMAQLSQG